MSLKCLGAALGLWLAAGPAAANELVYDPVPIYDETAEELLTTVLAKYEVGVTYVATREGRLMLNGAPHCEYRKVWEQTVLAMDRGVYTVEDRLIDNVNADCVLRERRVHIDDYTLDGWRGFLERARREFGEKAITVYVDKDEDVFGWSHNRDAINYAEVASWQEFLDRLFLMMTRSGSRMVGDDRYDFRVDRVSYGR